MPPKVVAGRYRLERRLAPGGMGLVFVAYDLRMRRNVALKMLPPDHGPVSIERFRREARAISELSHENIVTILDSGADAGEPYIVQELLSGRSLRTVLAEKPLPLRTAIELGLQCARGLSAAHAKGILHRDLKPENLHVTADGHLTILDFGLARMVPLPGATTETVSDSSDEGAANLTSTGQVLGTPAYMAPEQVRGVEVGLPADVFMFGLVLYEMVTGKKAFPGENRFDIATDIVFNEPEPLQAGLPAPLRNLVEKCLRKEPAARPTAGAAIRALEEVLRTASRRNLAAHGGVRRRRLLGARQLARAALLAVLVASAFWVLRSPAGGSFVRPQKVVMVLPFAATGSPASAHRVEQLLQALSVGLTQGDLQAVPPQTALRIYGGEKQTGDASPEELAVRMKAEAFITGKLSEEGQRLSVQAELRKPGNPTPLVTAQAAGDIANLLQIVNELCTALAPFLNTTKVAEGPSGRMGRLARNAVPPAAAAFYWEGEAALRRDDWEEARRAYEQAVRLAPGFAPAFYRLAMTESLVAPGHAHDAIQIALELSKDLQPWDRQLIEAYDAYLSGNAALAESRYLAIVAEHPEDVDAWYQLGETLFHLNPLRGRSIAEAETPMQQVLTYDPKHGGALDHLIDLAQMKGHPPVVVLLAERSLALQRKDPAEVMPIRWALSWANGDAVERKQLWAEAADPKTSWSALARCFERSIWQGDDLDDARRLADIAAARTDPLDKADGLDFRATVDLALGRWRSARQSLEEAARITPDHRHAYNLLWASTLDFFHVDDEALQRDLQAARVLPAKDSLDLLDKKFIQGALAARLREDDVAAEASGMLFHQEGELRDGTPRDLARAVRARVAFRHKDLDAAQRALDEMELLVPFGRIQRYYQLPESFLRAQLPKPSRPWLADSFQFADSRAAVYFAPMALLLGQQLEKAGDRESATRKYQRYLLLRKDADLELAAEVQSVRDRLKALTNPQ